MNSTKISINNMDNTNMYIPKLSFSNICDIIVNNNPFNTNGIYCLCNVVNEEMNNSICTIKFVNTLMKLLINV